MCAKRTGTLPPYHLNGIDASTFPGPLESKVLETLWSSDKRPLTVREVHRTMGSGLAYTTIMTTMNRLYEKGTLDREVRSGKGGLHYAYWPKLDRDAFERAAVQRVLDGLIDRFGEKVTESFVERISTDEEMLKKLKLELGRIEGER